MKAFSELTSASQVNNEDLLAISQTSGSGYASKKTTVKDITDKSNLNLAEEYDSTSTYAVDDYVIYESVLYKCIGTTTGTFDSTKWTSVVVTNEMGSSGGGGTGGHTIIDENGTSMTARAGLQFVGGANVSDDATNNKTIVDVASAGGIDGVFIDTDNVIQASTSISTSSDTTYTATEDCVLRYEIYSTSSLNGYLKVDNNWIIETAGSVYVANIIYVKKGQTVTMRSQGSSGSYTVYGIQTGTTHSKFQPVIYSTEEREIGVWTDGKPLYQKSYEVTITSGTQWIDTGLDSGDVIVESKGVLQQNNGDILTLASGDSGANAGINSMSVGTVTTGKWAVLFRTSDNNARGNLTLTLCYTKGTDTAGSGSWTPQGVPTHKYSTEEHIIGTWIDGSTLYEKTFYIHDRQFNSSGECDFDVISLNSDILMADNMASYYTFSISSTEYTRQFEKLVPEEGHVYAYGPANRQIETGYITIRYTKSS